MKRLVVALVLSLFGCVGNIEGGDWPPSYVPPDVPAVPECDLFTFTPSDLYPTRFPVNIVLDDHLTEHNRALMLEAIDAWNERMKAEVVYATITSNLDMHDKCNYAVVTDTTDLKGNWIGLTTYGQCASDIVNVETMQTMMAPGSAPPEYYTDDLVLNVTTHEIGHVLGLGHETNTASVMYPSVGPGDHRYITTQSYCLVQKAIQHTKL